MKETDFVVNRGIEKLQFVRGVTFNGKVSNLVVELKMNHKKGMFSIHPQLTNEQINDIEVENQATMKTVADLSLQAIKKGVSWRTAWKQARQKTDPDQLDVFDGDDGDESGAAEGLKVASGPNAPNQEDE